MASARTVMPFFDYEVHVMNAGTQFAHSQQIGAKVARIFQKRAQVAQQNFNERVHDALDTKTGNGAAPGAAATSADTPLAAAFAAPFTAPFSGALNAAFDPLAGYRYAIDVAQRTVLFWDTLRQRGNQFVDQTAQGLKPVLHFDYETVLDGRTFERPVNYALLRIRPPEDVTIDARKRPYVIIDPRAGHGPGIGGFKDDSQVGVALRAGSPVYFVVFFRDPEPGQTMLDVCAAEQRFVKKVRELHPDSPKPAIVGNCQGGWAAMMLATSEPDDTGPIVINGAPMSYWSGAWSEGEGDNPMRYAGGMLGGTWLASLTADLGNGKFDGAYLVQNFENLNPANSLWDKYYHVFDNVDTEPPRFLDFERWWGGYYLMNRDEIEWITRNLFVGNKLWAGEVRGTGGAAFDLRDIKSPIILFASLGDNITPPQQAFNWVADIYGSTDEIKARGQVIIGLMHQSIGHLGIFVSGKVAKKEHSQIVSVLEAIEAFPPGLYGMEITEQKGADGKPEYEVTFHEHRLEDIAAKFNRFKRVDELPFNAVEQVSEFNQRAYELFAQPFVQAMSNETTAGLLRQFHPLRAQRWMFSDLNPWLAWLGPAANAVKANRMRSDTEGPNPLRQTERRGAELISASLDFYRAMRDAATESLFFGVYGNLFAARSPQKLDLDDDLAVPVADPKELPFVKEALSSIAEGGYTEAIARTACLLARHGEPLPLTRLAIRTELVEEYAEYLPDLEHDQWRRIRGEQEIIVRYEPERALTSLPTLLAEPGDRKRFLTLVDKLAEDDRVQGLAPSPAQLEMVERIRALLPMKPGRSPRPASSSGQSVH
jgi:pimeloyl-ACP methyl ester carboxylesterase